MAKRRVQRLSDLLREEISDILVHQMKDPRLTMCSITEVVLSKDLRHAKVYVSVLENNPSRKEECVEALQKAEGFIRRELGRLRLRSIPSLTFYHDTGPEYSQHIEELLQSIKKEERGEEES